MDRVLRPLFWFTCLSFFFSFMASQTAWAAPGDTRRVSVSGSEVQATGGVSTGASFSRNGRFVVFESAAIDLVPGDSNNFQDIFIRDRRDGTTTRVSVSTTGGNANGASSNPEITADGRYVVFQSVATNLISPADTGVGDIFIRDTCIGAVGCTPSTIRVSVSSGGLAGNSTSQNPSISGSGRYVAFESFSSNLIADDTNNTWDVFVRDTCIGAVGCTPSTIRVSVSSTEEQGNNQSTNPSISGNGERVAFESYATNLVIGDTSGNFRDIFVRDLPSGTTTRISVDVLGDGGTNDSINASISANGGYVAFQSAAPNLVIGDTNGAWDIFVRDMVTNETTRVSVASDGVQGNSTSSNPSISADGRYVAFDSISNNLLLTDRDSNNNWDIFIHDRKRGATIRGSVSTAGVEGNSNSQFPSINGDGRLVAFQSIATNLIPGDTNDLSDVFVHQIGFPGQLAVNDFDGDGKSDIAVYRALTGVWFILQSTDAYNPSLYKSYSWGGEASDVPVSADYDGDGKTDIAVYRASTGSWYILQSIDAYDPVKSKSYSWGGDASDIPVPWDFDRDGKADIGIYRRATGNWYILQSSDAYNPELNIVHGWGGLTDIPATYLNK